MYRRVVIPTYVYLSSGSATRAWNVVRDNEVTPLYNYVNWLDVPEVGRYDLGQTLPIMIPEFDVTVDSSAKNDRYFAYCWSPANALMYTNTNTFNEAEAQFWQPEIC